MATTYELDFKFAVSTLRVAVKTVYGDTVHSDQAAIIEAADKIGMLLRTPVAPDTVTSATGGNLAYAAIVDVVAGGTTTIDLQSFTDLAGRTAQSLARYKFLFWMLLPASKGGTACSKVTVGNSGTGAHQLFLAADANAFELENGDWIIAGKGAAAGKLVDGTNHNVLITNNDGAVDARVLVIIPGAAT